MSINQLSYSTRRQIRKKLAKYPALHNFSISLHHQYCQFTGFLHVLPDYYIIGAAKSGTTSLANYLIQHPDVYPAVGKELYFFGKLYHRGTNWYRVNFPFHFQKFFIKNILKRQFLTGDSTPRYIDNPHVPIRIKKITPNAKFIVLLRNPIDRAFSHFQMNLRSKIKDLETKTFEESIDLESERTTKEFQKMCTNKNYHSENYFIYSYLHRGIYVDKLKFWFDVFPRNQFLIIQSEEMFNNPKIIYQKVLDFLNLSKFEHVIFEKHKVGKYNDQKIKVSTRKKLADFFNPYNESLYKLLGERYDWN